MTLECTGLFSGRQGDGIAIKPLLLCQLWTASAERARGGEQKSGELGPSGTGTVLSVHCCLPARRDPFPPWPKAQMSLPGPRLQQQVRTKRRTARSCESTDVGLASLQRICITLVGYLVHFPTTD